MITSLQGLSRAIRRLARQAPRRKTIFLHIPKTAGTSMREIVRQVYPGGDCVFIYDHDPTYLAGLAPQLRHATAVYGHYSYGIHELLGIEGRYVAILRDPVERVISFFRHQAWHADSEYYTAIQQGLTLHELLRSEACHQLNNHQVRIISGHRAVETVHSRDVLEQAQANIARDFACVAIAERMDESVRRVAATLGWRRIPAVQRLNVNRNPVRIEVDDATREAIRYYNRLDIELYEAVRRDFLEPPALRL